MRFLGRLVEDVIDVSLYYSTYFNVGVSSALLGIIWGQFIIAKWLQF